MPREGPGECVGGMRADPARCWGGSRLKVQRELGQGLETLPWEGFKGKGLGRTHRVWGGGRGGVCCPANTRGGRGGCAGRSGTWAWGRVFGQHQARGGEAGRRGLLHAARQLAERTHFVGQAPSPSSALQPPAQAQRQPARMGAAVCRARAAGPGVVGPSGWRGHQGILTPAPTAPLHCSVAAAPACRVCLGDEAQRWPGHGHPSAGSLK